MVCGVCHHDSPTPSLYRVAEMMHGMGDVFEYFECDACKCLQIKEMPENLANFYIPSAYYSFGNRGAFRQYAIEKRTQFLAGRSFIVGRLFAKLFRPESGSHPILRDTPRSARILEIGCGDGTFARKLFERGYSSITAIDPYMAFSQQRETPFCMRRASLEDFAAATDGDFDVILFNHVLEHIPSQHVPLSVARRLLRPDGVCIIRIPFASSFAWEHYRTNWVQLDAPRHLFLHTNESLKHLVESTGWRVESIVHDSYCLQFYGSEQYKLGIALRAPKSWHVNHKKSPFTPDQIARWEEESRVLNQQSRGDQITAYLRQF